MLVQMTYVFWAPQNSRGINELKGPNGHSIFSCQTVNPTIYTSAEFAARRAQPDSFVNRLLAQPYDVVAGGGCREPYRDALLNHKIALTWLR